MRKNNCALTILFAVAAIFAIARPIVADDDDDKKKKKKGPEVATKADLEKARKEILGAIVDLKKSGDERHTATMKRLDGLEKGQEGLRVEVVGVKKDVGDLKKQVTALQCDVTCLKEEVGGIRKDVTDLRADVAALQKNMDAFGEDFKKILADEKRRPVEIKIIHESPPRIRREVVYVDRPVYYYYPVAQTYYADYGGSWWQWSNYNWTYSYPSYWGGTLYYPSGLTWNPRSGHGWWRWGYYGP